ncbi:MAG: hypothetical protein FWG42_12585, partial [Clostridiales bacterium]|nr:hypothetical protein [Clostridiales bacterium]
MFCRYCGKKVFEDSVFCSFCGKRLTDEREEKPPLEAPFQSDPEFVWNLHEFPEHKKTGDIDFSWIMDKPTIEAGRRAREPKLEFELEPEGIPVPVPESKPEPSLESKPAPELEVDEKPVEPQGQESKIDKFFTFNHKNEEFQKLLDKEYERIKNKDYSEPAEQSTQESAEIQAEEASAEGHAEAPVSTRATQPPSPETSQAQEQGEKQADEALIYDNDTLAIKFDTRELHKDILESALERAGVSGVVIED